MNTVLAVLIGLIGLILITMLIISIYLLYFIKEELKKKRVLEEAQVYNELYLSMDNTSNLLDELINETFDEYKLFNPDIINQEYINELDQDKIRRDLVLQVNSRISPVLYSQLIIIFNKKELGNIIIKRCTLAVVNFVTEVNSGITIS